MPDASVTLDLDAREFDSRLAAVEQKVVSSSRNMSSGFGGAAEGGERLIRSSHRAASSIHTMAMSMASGADAATILGNGIEGLGRMLNINLGALAGIAIGAVLIQQLYKAQEEIAKTEEAIHELTLAASTDAHFETLTQLETKLKAVQDRAKELSNPGVWFWITKYLANEPGGIKAIKEGLEQQKKTVADAATAEFGKIADKMGSQAGFTVTSEGQGDKYHAERDKLEQERLEKIGEISQKFAGDTTDASKRALDAVNQEFDARKTGLDAQHFAEQRSLELQEKLLFLKEKGGDVDLNSAVERVKAAEKELQAAREGDKPKAKLKVEEEASKLSDLVKARTPVELAAGVASSKFGFGTSERRWEGGGFGSLEGRNNETGPGSLADRWNPMAVQQMKPETDQEKAFKAALQPAQALLKQLVDEKVVLVNK